MSTKTKIETAEAREKRLGKSRNQYRTDKKTLINHRYRMIVQRVTGRSTIKHPELVGLPYLSKEEYAVWVEDNMSAFIKIWDAWVASGHEQLLSPSIDRINNKLSYIPSNMQWLTTRDNLLKRNK